MRITILYGGTSGERDVSIMSAKAVDAALRMLGHDVYMHDAADIWGLVQHVKAGGVDLIFNALHGGMGEGGQIAGLLECLDVPYTHSGVRASAICLHKPTMRLLCTQAGIRCPRGGVYDVEQLREGGHMLPLPYVLKPEGDGSSIDLYFIRKEGDLEDALERGAQQSYLAEEYIEGVELSAAVLDGQVLGITEICPQDGDYDYAHKYQGGTVYHTPARIGDDVAECVRRDALKAHEIAGCDGVSRSDFRYDPARGVYFLETNTHPGMTEQSLVPKMAEARGISFNDLVGRMVRQACL